MASIKDAFALVLHGLKDCVVGVVSLKDFLCAQELQFNRENAERRTFRRNCCDVTIRNKLFQCAVFGFIFWLANFLFNNFFLQYAFFRLAEWTGYLEWSFGIYCLQKFLYGIFCVAWILPLLVISKILNFRWYQKIADLVLLKSGIKKDESSKISDFYADLTKGLILQMAYCLQGYLIYFAPIPLQLQNLWYLFHFSMLASLYAFEYKWVHKGWPLQRRILNIDHKWPYYLGFGLPLGLISVYMFSFIDSMIIFATLFPVYVISSSVTYDNRSPIFRYPFHTFRMADSISDMVIGYIMKFVNMLLGKASS